MGDVVTCKAVLHGPDEHGVEHLLLTVGKPDATGWPDYRIIPVRWRGTPRKTTGPEWEYFWPGSGDVLHMHPSLLCPDTPGPFHTDLDWTVAFVRLPPDDPRNADVLRFYDAVNGIDSDAARA